MLKNCFLLALLTLLFPLQPSVAGNSIDSLVTAAHEKTGTEKADLLIDVAGKAGVSDPHYANELGRDALKYSTEIGYDLGMIGSWLVLASLTTRSGEYTTSEEFSQKAVDLAKKIDNTHELAKARLALGGCYLMTGDYAKSFDLHLKGLKGAKEVKDTYLIATYLMNIGTIKDALGELDEAEKYWRETIDVLKEANALASAGGIYVNLGVLEYKRKNYGRSIEYNKRALEIISARNDKYQMGLCHYNIGFGYALLDEHDKAMKYFQESLKLRREVDDRKGIAKVLFQMAKVRQSEEGGDAGLALVEEVIAIGEELNDWSVKKDAYEFLAAFHESQGNYSEALKMFRAFSTAKDTIAVRANRSEVAQLETKYQVDELRKNNELQTQQAELAALSLKHRNTLIITLVLALLLLALTFFAVQQRSRIKLQESRSEHLTTKKKSQRLERELEEARGKLEVFAKEMVARSSDAEKARMESSTENAIVNPDADRILEKLNEGIVNDKDWVSFNMLFEAAYPDFSTDLQEKLPDATHNHIRLAALAKIQLSNKEIAAILNISRDSVVRAKYRLRQKMGFDTNQEMESFLRNL